MNGKELIALLFEEEGGELFRFDGIRFFVNGRTEGMIPHIHFMTADRKLNGTIRLDVAKYFPHGGKYTSKLSVPLLRKFLTYMTAEKYNEACELWNRLPNVPTVSQEMPDYSELA